MTEKIIGVEKLKTTEVVICGVRFPIQSKAPYTTSGKSLEGAIECAEDGKRIKCHECGRWFWHLAHHVTHGEGMNVSEYRRAHGLRQTTPLVAPMLLHKLCLAQRKSRPHRKMTREHKEILVESSLKARSEYVDKEPRHGYAELKNLQGKCKAQLTEQILHLAKSLGRTPTVKELKLKNIGREAVKSAYQMSYREALLSIGLNPRDRKPPKAHLRKHVNGKEYIYISEATKMTNRAQL